MKKYKESSECMTALQKYSQKHIYFLTKYQQRFQNSFNPEIQAHQPGQNIIAIRTKTQMIDLSQKSIRQTRQEARMQVHKLPDCQICLEALESDLVALGCGHVYHQECLKENELHRKQCCACKKVYTAQDVKELYFEAQKKARFVLGSKQALQDPEIKFAIQKFDQKMRKNRIYQRFELLKQRYLDLRKNHHKLSEEHHQAIERIEFLQYQLEGFDFQLDSDDWEDMDQEDNEIDQGSSSSSWDDQDQESQSQSQQQQVNTVNDMENQINRYLGIAQTEQVAANHPQSLRYENSQMEAESQQQDSDQRNGSDENSPMEEESQEQDQNQQNGSDESGESSQPKGIENSKGHCRGCGRIHSHLSSQQQSESSSSSSSSSSHSEQSSFQPLQYPHSQNEQPLNSLIKPVQPANTLNPTQQKTSNVDLRSELQQKTLQLSKLKSASLQFQFQATIKIEQSGQTIRKQEEKIIEMSSTIRELREKIFEINDRIRVMEKAGMYDTSYEVDLRKDYDSNIMSDSCSTIKSWPQKSSTLQQQKQKSLSKPQTIYQRKQHKFSKLKKISKPIKKKPNKQKIKKQRNWKILSRKNKNIIPRVRILRKKISKSISSII